MNDIDALLARLDRRVILHTAMNAADGRGSLEGKCAATIRTLRAERDAAIEQRDSAETIANAHALRMSEIAAQRDAAYAAPIVHEADAIRTLTDQVATLTAQRDALRDAAGKFHAIRRCAAEVGADPFILKAAIDGEDEANRALSASPATGGRDEAKRVVRIAYPEPGADLADEIVDLIYSLGARYRANATFVMNSKTAGVLRMVHDCDGRFLWSDAPTKGEPARLVGYPVRIDEGIPDIAFGIVAALRAEPPARDGGA